MTHDFKAGDRIRLISHPVPGHRDLGEVFTVAKRSECPSYVAATSVPYRDRTGGLTWAPAAYFERVDIDPAALRKGDKITAVLTVSGDGVDGDGDVRCEGRACWVPGAAIVSVVRAPEPAPEPLKAGDEVRTDAGNRARIVAIDEDHAWVKLASGGNVLRRLAHLTRA